MLPGLETLALAALGVVIGSIGSIIGLGGGFLAVPILILLFGFETHLAVGTSLLMMIFISVSGTTAYLRQRRVDLRLGIVFAVLMFPGAILGAYISVAIAGTPFKIAFALLVISMALYLFVKPRRKNDPSHTSGSNRSIADAHGGVFRYNTRITPGYFISVASGFLSSIFGIGAGAVQVPSLNRIVGLPLHIATATSFFMITLTSAVAVASHASLANVVPEFGIPLGVGGIFGAQLGALVARRMKARIIEYMLVSALIVIGLRLLISTLIG